MIPPSLTLAATAYTAEQFYDKDTPQVALAGRSNVGKSSLINALANRKALAKTSATPGKTRSINYYTISNSSGFLVDLPGYGYAKCSQQERNKWAKLLEEYFTQTKGLKALCLLIDSRIPPQELDIQLANYAVTLGLRVIPVLTKTDKCTKKQLDSCKRAWTTIFGHSLLFITSAAKRTGLDVLWKELLNTVEGRESMFETDAQLL